MAVARCGVNFFKMVVYSFLLFLSRHTFTIDKIVQGWRKFMIRISAWFRLNKRLRSSYTVFPSMLKRFLVERLICNKEAVNKKKKTTMKFLIVNLFKERWFVLFVVGFNASNYCVLDICVMIARERNWEKMRMRERERVCWKRKKITLTYLR